jgi:hypothetical protein
MRTYMGGAPSRRNKATGTIAGHWSLLAQRFSRRRALAEDREKLSTGPNDRPINDSIAGTGPGIPDDALARGHDLPPAPSDEDVERAARALGAPIHAKRDEMREAEVE